MTAGLMKRQQKDFLLVYRGPIYKKNGWKVGGKERECERGMRDV